jgi:hypothetical protein
MLVQVSKIDSNPYRRIDKYPINREKVEALKCSINQTGFWDNILLRQNGERFQLAYGHHRLTAIKELGIESVDVPVKVLDDATMLRVMANENMDEWKASPAVINETVLAAKEFIDAELAKYETWEEARSDKNIRALFNSQEDWATPKGRGAGRDTILAFLGGNWKQWMIQEALETIKSDKEGKVDRRAAETLQSIKSAQSFKAAVKEYDIPYEDQKEIAEKIVADGRDSKREVAKAVQEIAIERNLASFEDAYKPKPRLLIAEHLEKAIEHMIQVNSVIDSFFEYPDQVSPDRMKFFAGLVMKAGESIKHGIGGNHGDN